MNNLSNLNSDTWVNGLTKQIIADSEILRSRLNGLSRISEKLRGLNVALDAIARMAPFDQFTHVPVRLKNSYKEVLSIPTGIGDIFSARMINRDEILYGHSSGISHAYPGEYKRYSKILPLIESELCSFHITPRMHIIYGTSYGAVRLFAATGGKDVVIAKFDGPVISVQGLTSGKIACLVQGRGPFLLEQSLSEKWSAQMLFDASSLTHMRIIGDSVFTGDATGVVAVWDRDARGVWNEEQIVNLECEVSELEVLPNGRVVALCEKEMMFSDIQKDMERSVREYTHSKDLLCATGTLDGRIIIGLDDGTIEIQKFASRRSWEQLKGHTAAIRSIQILQDGRIISSADDGTIRIWDGQDE